MTTTYEYDEERARAFSRKWQIAVAVLVAIGCLLTAGYAFVENFSG